MGWRDRSLAFRVAALGGASVDPLSLLSDDFASGSASMAARGWTEVDDSTTPAGDGAIVNPTTSVTAGVGLLLQIDAGGGTGSLHLNDNRGVQWHKGPITAARWGVECRVTLRNAANSGDPPGTNYRLAGLLAHELHSNTLSDHVTIAWGTGNGAFPRAFWAHTIAGSSGALGNTTPGFNVSATLSGASRYLRMLRDFASNDRWVLQHKANLGDAWTTIRDVQRGLVTAMPSTVYVGPCLFSDQATHDVSGLFSYIRFFTALPSDFP